MDRVIELQEMIINIVKSDIGVKPRWLYSAEGWTNVAWLESYLNDLASDRAEPQEDGTSWLEDYLPEYTGTEEFWDIQSDLDK